MHEADADAPVLTPEQSWSAIHATMEQARSALHVAGATRILLLWGAIASLGYLAEYLLATAGSSLADDAPWIRAPLWGLLVGAGIAGSAVIGHRAGRELAEGPGARAAGLRVFFFWLAVAAAAFLVPAAAGLWGADDATATARVAIGIVALGYVLFGIVNHPLIAVVGAGIAAAYYLPSYLAGDLALALSAAGTLAVTALGAAWMRSTGAA
ncbi:MAG: hypothetical protein OXC94_11840 [Chloroflexi bacterium]|nr:hypothetical protein [Chloroflexota bacterium]